MVHLGMSPTPLWGIHVPYTWKHYRMNTFVENIANICGWIPVKGVVGKSHSLVGRALTYNLASYCSYWLLCEGLIDWMFTCPNWAVARSPTLLKWHALSSAMKGYTLVSWVWNYMLFRGQYHTSSGGTSVAYYACKGRHAIYLKGSGI